MHGASVLFLHVRFGIQPVLHILAALRAMLLIQAECSSGDLIVGRFAARPVLLFVFSWDGMGGAHVKHLERGDAPWSWGDNPTN